MLFSELAVGCISQNSVCFSGVVKERFEGEFGGTLLLEELGGVKDLY